MQNVTRFVAVCVTALIVLATSATDRTWVGGASTDWTLPGNYDPAGVPEVGDNLLIPTNITVKLISTNTASWEVANRLAYVKPETATSYFEVEVPDGKEASLACGVSFNASDWRSNDKGGLIKTGGGLLQLMKGGQRPYYTSITVSEGVLRSPTNLMHSGLFQFDRLQVAKGATFFAANGADGNHPHTYIRGLSGEGLITNTTSYTWGEVLYLNARVNTFDGTIGGRIRFYAGANLTLTATDNVMTGECFYAFNNAGAGTNGPVVAFTKMGMFGEPSSLGVSHLAVNNINSAGDPSAYFKYLGSGETSDKNITLYGATAHPSYFDAGSSGNLVLTGTLGIGYPGVQDYTFILTGDNEIESTLAGAINGYGNFTFTNIIKRGTGTWRFSDVERTWSGMLTVEDGTLRYESLAATGTACALGTAAKAQPYPILLKGGVFEYSGASRLEAKGRTIAVEGTATLRNASGQAFRLDGVTAATAGSTVVLDGGEGVTNALSGVTGGLSVCKTGEGVWLLNGEQSFTGDLTVSNGTLLVTRPKYEYYRLWFRHTVSNQTYFFVNEIGLYDKLGARQNGGMSFNMDKNSATALEPGEACIGASGRTFSYSSSTTVFANLFDDATSALHAYQKINGATKTINPDDESTWLPIVMRLDEDSAPVESYDVVIGGTYTANGKTRSVDNYLLQGSVDGVTWDDLNETNGYKQIGANYQWFFDGKAYNSGGAATHTTGKTIASRPAALPTLLDNAGYVSVAPNATIKALDDDVTISKIRVSVSGAGTIDNFRFVADNGTIDVTDIPDGVRDFTLPLSFANVTETDIANLSRWKLTLNGNDTSSWSKSIAPDGTIRLVKKGMIVVFR